MSENQKNPHKAGFVNIIGKPNAGKSTIMNALVGEKLAIITSKAQTTRHRLIGLVNGEDFQVIYSDTPGIIETKNKLQERMMGFVRSSFKDADVLLVMVEPKENDISVFLEKVENNPATKIFVLNKSDLLSEDDAEDALSYWKIKTNCDHYIAVSALKGENLKELFELILEHLPEHPPYYDKEELTDRPMKFFISEIIRQKIFQNYHQEIPYATEVEVEIYQEEPKIDRIRAIIYVAKESQKPIVIGRHGSKLKKVGSQARIDMENFLDKKVYLELFVKVRDNWRDDEKQLKRFGYE